MSEKHITVKNLQRYHDGMKGRVYDKTEIDALLADLSSNLSSKVTFEIVQTLPSVSTAKAKVIYFVPKSTAESSNVYDEYMLINNKLEKIGDTKIDLSGYLQKTDIVEATDAEIDAIINS